MTQEFTLMPTQGLQKALTRLTTGMRYQPWIHSGVNFFATIASILFGTISLAMLIPTFRTEHTTRLRLIKQDDYSSTDIRLATEKNTNTAMISQKLKKAT
jgi:hypothetical protein